MILLPHLGASTREAEENCAVMVAEQVRDYLLDGTIRNSVNFPDVILPQESQFRVAIANANVPNMVGGISHEMAMAGLNIATMTNKSKGPGVHAGRCGQRCAGFGDQGDRRHRRRADGPLPAADELTVPRLRPIRQASGSLATGTLIGGERSLASVSSRDSSRPLARDHCPAVWSHGSICDGRLGLSTSALSASASGSPDRLRARAKDCSPRRARARGMMRALSTCSISIIASTSQGLRRRNPITRRPAPLRGASA